MKIINEILWEDILKNHTTKANARVDRKYGLICEEFDGKNQNWITKKQLLEIKESIADELMKLADLKEKWVISNEEFLKMKQDLINKKPQF